MKMMVTIAHFWLSRLRQNKLCLALYVIILYSTHAMAFYQKGIICLE